MTIKKIMIIGMGLLLVACSNDDESTEAGIQPQAKVVRNIDFAQVQRGGRIYQQNCAKCHGEQAQGDPNWRHRDADGMFPPPPLNGSAHSWHHPMVVLKQVITNGSPNGMGRMPAWGGKLSEQEIEDVIAWFQAKWPDEVYQAWYSMNQRAMRQ
jgi:mono/diheme cytochrome c family protein